MVSALLYLNLLGLIFVGLGLIGFLISFCMLFSKNPKNNKTKVNGFIEKG